MLTRGYFRGHPWVLPRYTDTAGGIAADITAGTTVAIAAELAPDVAADVSVEIAVGITMASLPVEDAAACAADCRGLPRLAVGTAVKKSNNVHPWLARESGSARTNNPP